MFKKKRREADFRVVVEDGAGRVLQDASSAEFELPEAAVVALSVEYFNDPEPCEIHRAAVRWRALQQLREHRAPGGIVPMDALDAQLRALFPPEAARVRIVEDGP